MMTLRKLVATALVGALVTVAAARVADAGCGCDKPPPPRAVIRPFVGYTGQSITLIDRRFAAGREYEVHFVAADGTTDWSRSKAVRARDLADGKRRVQLRVLVGEVPLGPCTISVFRRKKLLYTLGNNQFTVIGTPIPLQQFAETISRKGFQAAIGSDGTVYFPVDVSNVEDPTTFSGQLRGFPLRFDPEDVVMYNEQGFMMQRLDPNQPGLFRITRGNGATSDTLEYWRHEFGTYNRDHRQLHAWSLKERDPDWHVDGTRHVDHSRIVVAVHGSLESGATVSPGATPPLEIGVTSSKKPIGEKDRDDDDDRGHRDHGDDDQDDDDHDDDD